MKRWIVAAMLAGSLASAAIVSDPAEAGHRGRSAGAFIGGLAAGAVIGGILLAPRHHPYYPPYAYPPYPYGAYGYYGYLPPPRCFRRVETYWNGYRWRRVRALRCY